jgi:L-malate glycosyltransferase
MLPFLRSDLTTTELFHNFAHNKNGMEFFGLANHQYLTHRFIYDNYTLNNIRKQYKEYGVPDSFLERIVFIEPGVTIPASHNKNYQLPLKILYAGRGGSQKRVWILNDVIQEIVSRKLPVEFYFAGTMQEDLNAYSKEHSTIYGPLHSEREMYDAYNNAQVLILTSQFEGFPMVIKESMACGCIPLVTALEGNKMHLEHLKNALLIENIMDEKSVAEQAINHIQFLLDRPDELERLSIACYQYAANHFNRELFYRDCRTLLTKQ